MDWLIVIISSLLSGLVGVIISNVYHNKSERKRMKVILLEQLLGNRFDIKGEKFTEALNRVFVVFYNNSDVIMALKAFHEDTMNTNRSTEISNQKLLDLFKAMCQDLDIDPRPLTDNFFLQPFNKAK